MPRSNARRRALEEPTTGHNDGHTDLIAEPETDLASDLAAEASESEASATEDLVVRVQGVYSTSFYH
jgi:hypothetical protein